MACGPGFLFEGRRRTADAARHEYTAGSKAAGHFISPCGKSILTTLSKDRAAVTGISFVARPGTDCAPAGPRII